MTISRTVYNQLFEHSDATAPEHVIRLRPTEAKAGAVVVSAKNKIQMWTQEEHERFLVALEMFPAGPWKKVADYIGTKTPRQTMTHAQKYRQKISRRQRGLRNQKKSVGSSAPNSPKQPSHMAVDTQADYKHAPLPIHSPYGVADVYVKSEDKGVGYSNPCANAGVDQSAGRLDMLARAMQMQSEAKSSAGYGYPQQQQVQQQQPLEMTANSQEGSFIMPSRALSPVPMAAPVAVATSPSSSSLPSLAQILNLRGSTGAQAASGARPGCSCNCSCSPSSKGSNSNATSQSGCQPQSLSSSPLK
ncbi:Myb-like dna-binding protein [Globisporangium polare]